MTSIFYVAAGICTFLK